MMALWQVWWVWLVAGLALGCLEVISPGYIFLGFAVGAAVTGGLVWLGWAGSGIAGPLALFAILSLGAWIALRRVAGPARGEARIWRSDINDD